MRAKARYGGSDSVVPRKLRKWFGLWLARTCCQQATGLFLSHNLFRQKRKVSVSKVEGQGTQTLPWHKHPSVFDRVTLRVALSSFGLLLQSIANRGDYGYRYSHMVVCRCIQTPPHRSHQHPVVVPPLVGIADNHRGTGEGGTNRIGRKRTLNLFENPDRLYRRFNTPALVQMGTVEQNLRAQSREPHGDSGFVYLSDLVGVKKPTFATHSLASGRTGPEEDCGVFSLIPSAYRGMIVPALAPKVTDRIWRPRQHPPDYRARRLSR